MKIFKKFLLLAACAAGMTAFAQELFPANGAADAFYDTQLVLSFGQPAELAGGEPIKILSASGSVVDEINFSGEKQTVGQYAINVGSQLVRAEGGKVFITPHFGKLKPKAEYSVVIPAGVIRCGGFNGIAKGQWKFTTKAEFKIPKSNQVSVDNSGKAADFYSVQGALSAISGKKGDFTVQVAPGRYYELVRYSGRANVTLRGASGSRRGEDTVIAYVNCNDLNGSTHTRCTFYCNGANLALENLTLENLTRRGVDYTGKGASGNSQAETIFFANGAGKTLSAYNCSFKSLQDTMQISGKCWFYDCYVAGDIDYVWGSADVALFENCDFNCVFETKNRSYLFETRVGDKKNSSFVGKGFVLLNSAVKVDAGQTAYFGRRATDKDKPTTYFDQCALVNVKFWGEGKVGESWWFGGKEPEFRGDSSNVGWKHYNVSFDLAGRPDESLRYENSAVLSDELYKAEYSSRNLIMNRKFSTRKNEYSDSSKKDRWDLDKFASERGYKLK